MRQAFENGTKTILRAQVKSPSQLTLDMIVSAARQGDALTGTALTEAGEALGIGISNAIQLFNPSLVVLTGKLANVAGDFLLDAVTRTVHSQSVETIWRGLEIRLAPFRKDRAGRVRVIGVHGCGRRAGTADSFRTALISTCNEFS